LGHRREHEGEWVICDVSEFVPPGMILDDIRIGNEPQLYYYIHLPFSSPHLQI